MFLTDFWCSGVFCGVDHDFEVLFGTEITLRHDTGEGKKFLIFSKRNSTKNYVAKPRRPS